MTIARHNNFNRVCCDSCPASYPNTYADEDWGVMISDAKTAGWIIRPVKPAAGADTSDLFGKPPRIAGTSKAERWSHTCPACANPIIEGRLF